ncbi:hypothetical protein BB560_002970 [Smittium megazygosporum]|uniref:t-SNARE coiled-coil homology domain-containing protein n=2 Tax=Smittium TaxID=4888 RepID=A0A2T9ZDA0_9FUNG|nr:hypothetical protein BB560_002970 [Smittium megazygosporum]
MSQLLLSDMVQWLGFLAFTEAAGLFKSINSLEPSTIYSISNYNYSALELFQLLESMDPLDNIEDFLREAFDSVATVVKRANKLDIKEIDFYCTIDPLFSEKINSAKRSSCSIINSLVSNYEQNDSKARNVISEIEDIALLVPTSSQTYSKTITTQTPSSSNNREFAVLDGQGYRDISSVTDTILDRIDSATTLFKTGKSVADNLNSISQSQPVVTSYSKISSRKDNDQIQPITPARKSNASEATAEASELKMIHASKIPRPQLKFKDTIDNSNSTNFVWKIKYKPFAQVPLEYSLPGHQIENENINRHLEQLGLNRSGASTPSKPPSPTLHQQASLSDRFPASSNKEETLDFSNSYINNDPDYLDYSTMSRLSHPYEYEIKNYTPPQRIFEVKPVIKSNGWVDDKNFEFVETPEQLDSMISEISQLVGDEGDIAIDLEHHNYRSFMGFTCLIQLSSRKKDYIIDSLELRHELYKLNELTADPSRIKVFHGADSDMIWLQRDFGVYVVGLFDTSHASRTLGFPRHSLQYLLHTIPKVDVDKKYQLADWRIRPLPQEMVNYARSDTHYLLEIFDHLRNSLYSVENGLNAVINKSKQTALRVFVKEHYDSVYGLGSNGWSTLLEKHNIVFSNKQMSVYRSLHAWRDEIARINDESIRYVLPNYMLLSISFKIPDTVQKLFSICIPTPPLVRIYSSDIIEIIKDALLNTASIDTNDINAGLSTESGLQKPSLILNSSIEGQNKIQSYEGVISHSDDMATNYPIPRFSEPLSVPLASFTDSSSLLGTNNFENEEDQGEVEENSGLNNDEASIDQKPICKVSMLFGDDMIYETATKLHSESKEKDYISVLENIKHISSLFFKPVNRTQSLKEDSTPKSEFAGNNVPEKNELVKTIDNVNLSETTPILDEVSNENNDIAQKADTEQDAVLDDVDSKMDLDHENSSLNKEKQTDNASKNKNTLDIQISDDLKSQDTIILSEMNKSSRQKSLNVSIRGPNSGKNNASKRKRDAQDEGLQENQFLENEIGVNDTKTVKYNNGKNKNTLKHEKPVVLVPHEQNILKFEQISKERTGSNISESRGNSANGDRDLKNRTVEFRSLTSALRKRQAALEQSNEKTRDRTVSDRLRQKSHFTVSAKDIASSISETTVLLEELANLSRKRTVFEDNTADMNLLTQQIKQNLAGINMRIKELQKDSHVGKQQGKQQIQHNSNVVISLQSRLASTSNEFKEVLESQRENLFEVNLRREQLMTKPPSEMGYSRSESYLGARARPGKEPRLRVGATSSGAPGGQQRASGFAKSGYENTVGGSRASVPNSGEEFVALSLPTFGEEQSQQLILQEDRTRSYLESRSNAIGAIESTISELGSIFQQLSTMVAEQSDMVQRIDTQTEDIYKIDRNLLTTRWLFVESQNQVFIDPKDSDTTVSFLFDLALAWL